MSPAGHQPIHSPIRHRSKYLRSLEPGHAPGSAILIDRDGVLVQDVHYLTDPSELILLPGAVNGIRHLQDHFRIAVVTNQSAIARGLLNTDGLYAIHEALLQTLQRQGAFLDAIYACPHHPEDGCQCRKPQPGMLLQASIDLGIDLKTSYVIGDKGSDLVAGERASVKATILIPSYQTPSLFDLPVTPTYVAEDLCEAAEHILGAVLG